MKAGSIRVRLEVDTTELEEALARLRRLPPGRLERVELEAPPAATGALLGGLAAAVALREPVSRRRLLFPWRRS